MCVCVCVGVNIYVEYRWLDKAAIETQENRETLCTVKQVSEVKHILTLIPMWANFWGYCLVEAAGNTFFIAQSSNLDGADGIIGLLISANVTQFTIQNFPLGWEKGRQKCGSLMRIGAGMLCSILCCLSAWQVEVHRRGLIDPDNPDETIPMTVVILYPQFLLLGLMTGLAEPGLQEFVDDHIPVSMKSYGSVFSECGKGFGYFVSVPSLLLFRRSFSDNINTGHLERYFLYLAILSSIFFCIFVYSSSKYAQMEEIPSEPTRSSSPLAIEMQSIRVHYPGQPPFSEPPRLIC